MKKESFLITSDKIIFVIYIAIYLIAAILVAWNQPMGLDNYVMANPPDEPARFLVPWYIYNTGHLPTGLEPETRFDGYGFSYAIYPMLPYIIQGYFIRFAGLFTNSLMALIRIARMVNVFFGLLTAVVTYFLSKRIFTDRRFRWCFCFLVTFIPQHVFMHTYVNTDSMCILSTAIIVYGLVAIYQDGISLKRSIGLSVGLILCIMSYYNAYGYVLASIILMFAYFIKRSNGKLTLDYKPMLKWFIIITAIVFAGAGWHFIRNAINLNGDFLGMRTRNELETMYALESVNPLYRVSYYDKGYSIFEMIKEMDFFGGAFISMVATYGSLNIMANVWMYRFYKFIFAGIILWPIMRIISLISGEKLNIRKLFFDINMIFVCAFPVGLLLYYAYKIDGQNQGRYILPALIPMMWCAVKGFERLLTSLKISDFAANVLKSVFCYGIMIVSAFLLLSFIIGTALPMYSFAGFVLP